MVYKHLFNEKCSYGRTAEVGVVWKLEDSTREREREEESLRLIEDKEHIPPPNRNTATYISAGERE